MALDGTQEETLPMLPRVSSFEREVADPLVRRQVNSSDQIVPPVASFSMSEMFRSPADRGTNIEVGRVENLR